MTASIIAIGEAEALRREEQLELTKENNCLTLRNALARVVKGHIRLVVDIWGKVELSSQVGVGKPRKLRR